MLTCPSGSGAIFTGTLFSKTDSRTAQRTQLKVEGVIGQTTGISVRRAARRHTGEPVLTLKST